jgi:predicted Rossmann-fold nucleotide-binding protein
MSMADVYILFNGGTGTISEFGMAWGLARIHFGHHRPLILFGQFWHEIIESLGKHMKLRPEELKVYHIVTTPEETVIKVKSLEAGP